MPTPVEVEMAGPPVCESLAQEIERIVGSPYPTQLKYLRDLVCSPECSDIDINQCLTLKSCKIYRLVTCILDALPHWHYTVDIVTRLSSNVYVRDAFLQQEPSLLHNITSHALSAEGLRPRYAAAAVALLSHPLESSVPLPSGVQTLFVRLVDRALSEISSKTIRPVYQLLKGTSTLLLGLLGSRKLAKFEEQIIDILRFSAATTPEPNEEKATNAKSTRIADQFVSLYCLAIMKIVITAHDQQSLQLSNGGSWNTQEFLNSDRSEAGCWDVSGMREYFTGQKKGLKILDLLALKAVDAIRVSDQRVLNTSLSSLRLVNEVMTVIPGVIAEQYCATEQGFVVIKRIQQKGVMPDLDPRLRALIFAFITQLRKADGLLSDTVDSIRELISKPKLLSQLNHLGDVSIIDHFLAAGLGNGTITTVIRALLEHAAYATDKQMLEACDVLAHAIRKIAVLAEYDDRIIEASGHVLSEKSSEVVLMDLQRLLSAPSVSMSQDSQIGEVCDVVAFKARSTLCHEISRFLVRAALKPGSHYRNVSSQHTALLLDLFAVATRGQVKESCKHVKRARSSPAVHFVEATSPRRLSHGNWREALAESMAVKGQAEQQAMISKFAEACADLEQRCEGVEKPLREEQEERQGLQIRYDELKKAFEEKEAQLIEHKLQAAAQVESLESDKREHVNDLEMSRARADELEDRVAELQTLLQEKDSDAERKSASWLEEKTIMELDHAASLASKNHELEDLHRQRAELRSDLARRGDETERLGRDLEGETKSNEALRQEIREIQAICHDKDMGLALAQERSSGELAGLRGQLEAQLVAVRQEMEAQNDEHGRYIEELRQITRKTLEDNNATHNKLRDELCENHGEEFANLEREFQAFQFQAKQEQQHLDQEVIERDEKIQKFQQQSEKLRIKTLEQEKEIKRLLWDKSRLDAVKAMFAQVARAQESQDLPEQPNTAANMDTQVYEDASPPTPTSGGHLSCSPRAGDSGGPTPKRAKPRRSFKTAASPAKQRARFSLEGRTKTPRPSIPNRAFRQPLHDLSANESKRKLVAGMELKPQLSVSKPKLHKQSEGEETRFDGSEIFAGTQLQLDKAMAGMDSSMHDDEETQL